ncbi:hypothetical protein BDM02DRAFT_3124422 [Thelephora ganbajun]|uniref:Uncharacterized protein n=1 Tax=Thelephora ganbajun TaxID=370292 RepID=A0ACB6YZ99_THEGA|nr:hypothetical protein BDM02DRAFT_3124422 [Thelephora ganbajun]
MLVVRVDSVTVSALVQLTPPMSTIALSTTRRPQPRPLHLQYFVVCPDRNGFHTPNLSHPPSSLHFHDTARFQYLRFYQ